MYLVFRVCLGLISAQNAIPKEPSFGEYAFSSSNQEPMS